MATWTNGTKASSTFNNITRTGVALWSDVTALWSDSIYTWGGVGTIWSNQPLGYYEELQTEDYVFLTTESGEVIVTETYTTTPWSLQTKN